MALALVTGACGFMGTHMVEVLLQAGHRVRATDLASSYESDDFQIGRFPGLLKKLDVEFRAADVTWPESLTSVLEGVDYVFHIAAIFNYSTSWSLLHRVNVEGTQNLLRAIRSDSSFKKIILWGAGGIYRFPKGPQDLPVTENSLIEPSNNYLKSKWEQECLVRDYCRENGLRFSVIRPTTVYGPRAIYGGGQMVLDVLKMKKLAVPRNFMFRIPTVHVRDVCRAALYLAEHGETDGESYNVNDNSQTTTIQYMEMIARLTNKPFSLLPVVPMSVLKFNLKIAAALGRWRKKFFGGKPPKFEKDSVRYFGIDYVCSNAKLNSTGFQFEYPEFSEGLAATLPWYKEHFVRG